MQMGKRMENWLFPGSVAHRQEERRPLLSDDEEAYFQKKAKEEKPPTVREAFTRQSTLNIILYFIVALHVTFDQLLPVFMSTPPVDPSTQHPPFRFAGGFGLNSNQVGNVFSVFGALGMMVQFFIFPRVARKYGALKCLSTAFAVFPFIFVIVPYTVLAAETKKGPIILCLFVAVKKIAEVFIFPCLTIMVTNSAPTLRVLGTLNGIATAVSALGRGVGPTFGGWLFSTGQKVNCVVLPYFALAFVTALGFIPLSGMIEMEGPSARDKQDNEDTALITTDEEDVDSIVDHRAHCVACQRKALECHCETSTSEEEATLPPPAVTTYGSLPRSSK